MLWKKQSHDDVDVIKWRHFPGDWPFVWGIHQLPMVSPNKGQWHRALIFFFYLCRSKQSWGWWFETPLCSLWGHRNAKDCLHSSFCNDIPHNTFSCALRSSRLTYIRLTTDLSYEIWGIVVICFVVVMSERIYVNLHRGFIWIFPHMFQICFNGFGAILWLPSSI